MKHSILTGNNDFYLQEEHKSEDGKYFADKAKKEKNEKAARHYRLAARHFDRHHENPKNKADKRALHHVSSAEHHINAAEARRKHPDKVAVHDKAHEHHVKQASHHLDKHIEHTAAGNKEKAKHHEKQQKAHEVLANKHLRASSAIHTSGPNSKRYNEIKKEINNKHEKSGIDKVKD